MSHLQFFSTTHRLAWTTAVLLAGVFAVVWSPKANADNAQLQTLLQRNNCTACHLIDKRKYGPHLSEVAGRYAGHVGSVAMLATKIRAGGSGVWGEDMMPPQPNVSEADARTLAELILALKP
jgi:cytochrome c